MQYRLATLGRDGRANRRPRRAMAWAWPLPLALACLPGCGGCKDDVSGSGKAGLGESRSANIDPTLGAAENRTAANRSRAEMLAELSPPVDAAEATQFLAVSNAYAGRFRGVFAQEGQGGAAFFVDRELAYPALTCINPQCPAQGRGDDGDPFLFVREFKDVRQGPDGQIIWPANPEITADPVCPACRQNGTIRPYVLPSTQRRMGALQEELQQARQAYQVAKGQRLPRAADHRTPGEIMQEMESLKQLYLVPGQR